MSKTDKQILGQIGEDEACNYLRKLGFRILTRNYLKPWGEIDIVAQKGNIIHFVEVKTVSYGGGVSHETLDTYEPEDNIHPWKLKRLVRVIDTYLVDNNIDEDKIDWQLDCLAVYIDKGSDRIVKTDYLEDVL